MFVITFQLRASQLYSDILKNTEHAASTPKSKAIKNSMLKRNCFSASMDSNHFSNSQTPAKLPKITPTKSSVISNSGMNYQQSQSCSLYPYQGGEPSLGCLQNSQNQFDTVSFLTPPLSQSSDSQDHDQVTPIANKSSASNPSMVSVKPQARVQPKRVLFQKSRVEQLSSSSAYEE